MKDISQFHCTIEATMSIIGGKYKPIILWHLIKEGRPLRFSELQRCVKGATPKMLTQQLRELEEDRILTRTVYPVVPPHTEYSLTELGETIIPVIKELREWGKTYFEQAGQDNPCNDSKNQA